MKLVAVDNGLTGAACVLEKIGESIVPISIIDLPVAGEGAKRRLNAPLFARWLTDHAPQYAVVEQSSPMPRQGVSSMFRYGRVCGAVEGILAARSIPITFVTPATWKKALRLDSNKENRRARAIELFPSAAGELQRHKDHNRAECLLLGMYGLNGGQL